MDQKQNEPLSFHILSKNKLINIDVIEEINENNDKKKHLETSTKKRKLKKMLHIINDLNNLEVPSLGDILSSSKTTKSSSMNNLKVGKLQIPEKSIGEQNFYSVYEKSTPSFTFISPRNKKSRSIYDASKSKRLHYPSCQQIH